MLALLSITMPAVTGAPSPATEPPPGPVGGEEFMKTCLRLTCVAMIALASATAQPQTFPLATRGVPVRGEITSASSVASSLTVELASNGTEISETANVNADGTFEFRSASPGTHWLRVVAGNSVIHDEVVNISGPRQTLSINLKHQSSANRSAPGSLSTRHVTPKAPRQAHK